MVEKRRSPRIGSVNLSYICLDKQEKVLQQAMGRTINLSEGGFLLETHFPMKEGYTLMASIGLEDDTIDVKGKVIHCQSTGDGKYVTGVAITSIEDSDKSLWVNFIHKIFSDDVPETDTDT